MVIARAAFAVLACLVLAAFDKPPTTNPDDLKPLRPGVLPGYMARDDLINSLHLLPPPPEAGSAEHAADEAAYKAIQRHRGTARWEVAQRDAILMFPAALRSFSCALGLPISQEKTPHLNMLLRRSLIDAGLATYRAKDKYNRPRPFMAANDPICTPAVEETLRKDGSYPSGHAALGWAGALVLTEIAPDRANALAQRGRAFGESRMVCGVHWLSDVRAGQFVGAAVVAQLHANRDFLAQLAEAKKEVAAARAAAATAPIHCTEDDAALDAK